MRGAIEYRGEDYIMNTRADPHAAINPVAGIEWSGRCMCQDTRKGDIMLPDGARARLTP